MPAKNTSKLRPIDDLDSDIVTLATRINAATYELLVLVREFEERAGYVQWGLDNCAEWLAWRCDISMTTALEKVRVARALKFLPLISGAFAAGELSYSKVRSLTRVAHGENEAKLVEFALRHTAAHVAQHCRELRCGSEESLGIAERAWAKRSLRVRHDHQRGVMSISIDLPVEAGQLLEKALDKARDDEVLEIPDLVATSWSVRQADAFMNVVMEYLSGERPDGSSKDNYLVTIHVDQSALAGREGRAAVPIETVKRLCCDSKAVVLTENERGQPLSIGRKSRTVPAAIERAVRSRDNNTCRFPGCRNHRFLDCHHVEHWVNNGETEIGNLLLLCSKHHTLVHEGGFRLKRDYLDNWVFMRPDGIAVPEIGYVAKPYDDPPRGGSLSVAENRIKEPPPPVYLH
ncbi:MAG: DUF222 domain-containing protein [Woeseiaceae bacterium]|nr:DUF222 domain-containing protein [Woeseiaceae bacterium]